MVKNMKEIGKKAKCTEKELSSGLMEDLTQVIMLTIKSMDLVFFVGLMEVFIKVTGNRMFNMEKVSWPILREFKPKEYGKTVLELALEFIPFL